MSKNTPIPVFFHCSNEYCSFVSVTMISILKNTKSYVDFFIIHTGVTIENQKRFDELKKLFSNFSIHWIPVEYDEIFKKEYFSCIKKQSAGKAWPGIHAFCTPFMPLLRPELDKFIYLDSDVICLKDIKSLYDEDLENYAIGGVPDIVVPLFVNKEMCDSNPKIPYRNFGNYFNAGVLLVNAKKFRQDNVIKEYFKILSTEIVSICDQDVLNRMFGNNKFKKLSQIYNVIYQPSQQQLDKNKIEVSSKVFLEASQNAVIRHYADAKPWNNIIETWSKKDLPDWKIYWHYAKYSPFYDVIFNFW